MRRVSLVAAASVALTGCAVVPSFLKSSGGGDAPALDESRIAVVEPLPGRDKAAPFKPTWCANVQIESYDDVEHFDELQKAGTIDSKEGRMTMRALCRNPGDKQYQRVAGYLAQFWINVTGLPAADAIKSLSQRMSPTWSAEWDQQCGLFADRPAQSAEAVAWRNLHRTAFQCQDAFTNQYEWYLDRDANAPSQVLQAAVLIASAPAWNDPASDKTMSYLQHRAEFKKLDAKKAATEIASARWNSYGATRARELISIAITMGQDAERALQAKAAEDPGYRTVIAAADKAWSDWEAMRAKNREIFDDGIAFEKAIAGPDIRVGKGCGERFRNHARALLVAGKPKTYEGAMATLSTGAVAEPLSRWITLCDALEDNQLFGGLYPRDPRDYEHRGPRAATARALEAALTELAKTRTDFPLRPGQVHRYGRIDDDRFGAIVDVNYQPKVRGDQKEVASVEKSGDGVKLTYKRNVVSGNSYDNCTYTNKIKEITAGGTVIYAQDCKFSGTWKEDRTPAPDVIPAAFAAGIKRGSIVEILKSFPLAVYDGKQKVTAAVGIPY